MTTRAIRTALKAKGLEAEELQFIGGPSGNGWLIVLSEDSEQALIDAGFDGDFDPDCATTEEALAWVAGLPDCTEHNTELTGGPLADRPGSAPG